MQTTVIKDLVSLESGCNLGVVIFPNSTSNLMATQIKSLELDFANAKFLGRWMLCRLVLNQSLSLPITLNLIKSNRNKSESK